MSAVHASPLTDTSAEESEQATTVALAITAGLASLAAVVVGFVLVALSILDVIDLPIGWGGVLCVAGWAAATLRRDRSAQS